MGLRRDRASSKWKPKVEARSWKRRELEKEEREGEEEERMKLFILLGIEVVPSY